MAAGDAVYLTLEHPVGYGPLGEYIMELMARNLTVVIRPSADLVEQLKVPNGEEKQD